MEDRELLQKQPDTFAKDVNLQKQALSLARLPFFDTVECLAEDWMLEGYLCCA